jgi:hypothetical protein
MAEAEPTTAFQLYHYDPSLAAAVISAIIFLVTTLVHIWQMFKHRTWFFVAFIVGGFCKEPSHQPIIGVPASTTETMLTASKSSSSATQGEPTLQRKHPTSLSARTSRKVSSFSWALLSSPLLST